jgi:hypothetical protein
MVDLYHLAALALLEGPAPMSGVNLRFELEEDEESEEDEKLEEENASENGDDVVVA